MIPTNCSECDGLGEVQVGDGYQICESCDGEGEVCEECGCPSGNCDCGDDEEDEEDEDDY